MPFNWKTPFGYLVAWCGQAAGWSVVITVAIPHFTFCFGSSLIFIFIAKDITKDLVDFNDIVKAPNVNLDDIMERFCNMIRLYSDAKE